MRLDDQEFFDQVKGESLQRCCSHIISQSSNINLGLLLDHVSLPLLETLEQKSLAIGDCALVLKIPRPDRVTGI